MRRKKNHMLTNTRDVVLFLTGNTCRKVLPFHLTVMVLTMSGHLRVGVRSMSWTI
jgi:hypothetical protein